MANQSTQEKILWAVKFTKGAINIAVNNTAGTLTIDGAEFAPGGIAVSDELNSNGERSINIQIDGNWTSAISTATIFRDEQVILYQTTSADPDNFIKNTSNKLSLVLTPDNITINFNLNRIFNSEWNWLRAFDEREFPGITSIR